MRNVFHKIVLRPFRNYVVFPLERRIVRHHPSIWFVVLSLLLTATMAGVITSVIHIAIVLMLNICVLLMLRWSARIESLGGHGINELEGDL